MSEETNNEIQAPPLPALVGVAALLITGAAWYYWPSNESYTSTEVAEVVHGLEEGKASRTGPLFTEDDKARQLVVDQEFAELKSQLVNEKRARKDLEDKIEGLILDNRQAFQRQLKDLTQELTQNNRSIIENAYLGDRQGNGNATDQLFGDIDELLNSEDQKASLSGPLNIDKKDTNPFGDGYIVLDMSLQHTAAGQNQTDINSNLSDIPSRIEQRVRDNGNATGDNLAAAKNNSRAHEFSEEQEPAVDSTGKQLKNTESYEIPAFSFAKVTTLHGVSCPIGANAVGTTGGVPARPVVVPIHGVFFGPNGAERDIGTAHLYGFCSGFRTSDKGVGRAEIKIVKLSYWDEHSGSQFLDVSGYIVDETYNQEIKGDIDNAKMSVLGQQSFAAAMVALNSNLAKEEFTNVTTDQGSQSVLTGDAMKVAGTEGISAAFTEISRFYNNQAQAAIDTVKVPGGLSLKFVSDLPMKVFKAADPIEKHSRKYWDVLI